MPSNVVVLLYTADFQNCVALWTFFSCSKQFQPDTDIWLWCNILNSAFCPLKNTHNTNILYIHFNITSFKNNYSKTVLHVQGYLILELPGGGQEAVIVTSSIAISEYGPRPLTASNTTCRQNNYLFHKYSTTMLSDESIYLKELNQKMRKLPSIYRRYCQYQSRG